MTSDDEHLRAWADLHRTQPPGGFVGGWVRASAAVARPLARAGVSPNMVTVAAMVAGGVAVPLALVGGPLGPAAACLAVAVSGLLDSLDGAVAVQAGRTTRVGFLLDSALDRLADAAFPVALALVANERGTPASTAAALAVAAVGACWYLEYVRARATLARAEGRHAWHAPGPGAERVDEPGQAELQAEPGAEGPAGPGQTELRAKGQAEPQAGPGDGRQAERQVITPGERPTRIVLTAVGLGLPSLALAALWAQVVIVGGSAVFLLAHSLTSLRRLDGAARPGPTG